jgi:hypothetical protein
VTALDILLLHSFGRNGKPEKSGEEATDIVGGIVAADMAHEGWTCQPLRDGLTPFHNSIINPILQEKRENLLGDLVGGMGGGRTRNDTDPYDDGPRLPFSSSPSGPRVKKRAGSTDDQLIFQALIRSRISGPTLSQTPLSGVSKTPRSDLTGIWAYLPTGLRKSVVRKSERVVAVPGDAVVVGSPLVPVGCVLGDEGGIAGEGESGEIGKPRRHIT